MSPTDDIRLNASVPVPDDCRIRLASWSAVACEIVRSVAPVEVKVIVEAASSKVIVPTPVRSSITPNSKVAAPESVARPIMSLLLPKTKLIYS